MMYQMGVYCRLSKDDGENKVSESIENQMKLIREYVTKSEDLEIADIYIDDGYSGLYFANRPGISADDGGYLQRENSRRITKDISRLGREHIETSNYIERVFPSFGCALYCNFGWRGILFITVMKNWHSLRRCLMICIVVIYLRKSEVH